MCWKESTNYVLYFDFAAKRRIKTFLLSCSKEVIALLPTNVPSPEKNILHSLTIDSFSYRLPTFDDH